MTDKLDGCIGQLRNNWRGRFVYVYPTDNPDEVRTEGWPFAGGPPVVCIEKRADWKRVLDLFPQIAVYD
jgi:hypothetical protein